MKYILISILFIISILLETSITTLPFVLLFVVLYSVLFRDETAFIFAFIGGLLLDILLFRPIGQTAIFFLPLIMLIFLYQRKFEIRTIQFTLPTVAISALIYLSLFVQRDIFLQMIVITVIGAIFFMVYNPFVHETK